MNKSDRIRKLLSQGVAVKEIAKRVGVKPSFVYVIRWQDKNKNKNKNKKKPKKGKAQFRSKRSKLIQAVFQAAKEVDSAVEKGFVEVTYPLPDPVNHPPHYKSGGIETIDFIEAKDLNYRLGNVIKYVSRAGKKDSDPIQDLEKAAWYLRREIDTRKKA